MQEPHMGFMWKIFTERKKSCMFNNLLAWAVTFQIHGCPEYCKIILWISKTSLEGWDIKPWPLHLLWGGMTAWKQRLADDAPQRRPLAIPPHSPDPSPKPAELQMCCFHKVTFARLEGVYTHVHVEEILCRCPFPPRVLSSVYLDLIILTEIWATWWGLLPLLMPSNWSSMLCDQAPNNWEEMVPTARDHLEGWENGNRFV